MSDGVWKALWNRLRKAANGQSDSSGLDFYVAVGLGNPGSAYEKTRHNIGFEVIDRLAQRLGASGVRKKFGALVREGRLEGRKILLVQPQMFMNRSGEAVASVMGYYRLGLDRLLVITDDTALEPGRVRLRPKGSSGGHKGLADIIEKVQSEEFARLRVGIGSCGGDRMAEYVLSVPPAPERILLDRAVEQAVQAVLCWVQEGLGAAMNRYNSRESTGFPEGTEPAKNGLKKPNETRNL